MPQGTVESDGFITLYPLQSAASADAAAEAPPTVREHPGDEGTAGPSGDQRGG